MDRKSKDIRTSNIWLEIEKDIEESKLQQSPRPMEMPVKPADSEISNIYPNHLNIDSDSADLRIVKADQYSVRQKDTFDSQSPYVNKVYINDGDCGDGMTNAEIAKNMLDNYTQEKHKTRLEKQAFPTDLNTLSSFSKSKNVRKKSDLDISNKPSKNVNGRLNTKKMGLKRSKSKNTIF